MGPDPPFAPPAPRPPGRPGPARWWTDRRRLLLLLLLAWGKGSEALTERFATARQSWPAEEEGQTYQGFLKAWRTAGLRPVYAAADYWRSQMQAQAGAAWTVDGWCAVAADGSRFELARTAEHERVFGVSGREGSGPQLWVTMLWHLGLGLPWAWKVGRADASERHHLRTLGDLTPPGCLLVLDAGFTGYELLRDLMASGRHVLVRVGRQVELLEQLGLAQVEKDGTVYLWPAWAQQKQVPPLTLRLITLTDPAGGREPVYLLTSVLDPAALSDAQAGRIYDRRWGIELAYRTLKQTLEARKLRSHAPVPALLEIHGLILGLAVLGGWTRRALAARGQAPASWSPAAAARIVRRGLHRPERAQVWADRLAAAVRDPYLRKRKVRVHWPRKKHADPPPGPPRRRRATPAECRRAQALVLQ